MGSSAYSINFYGPDAVFKTVKLTSLSTSGDAQDHGYLTNMAVAPNSRRQGVGAVMLQVRDYPPCHP